MCVKLACRKSEFATDCEILNTGAVDGTVCSSGKVVPLLTSDSKLVSKTLS